MTGVVKNLQIGKGFGFIRDEKGTEYFFHRDDFSGHWDDLTTDILGHVTVQVEFEGRDTPKGARADNVRRLDWPNN